MVSSTTFLSPSPPSVAARLSETVYGRHELSIILDAPFDMHATLSHDTPAASACALLYAVLPWFEVSSRFNHERRWLPSRLNCPDTVSLGIGNKKRRDDHSPRLRNSNLIWVCLQRIYLSVVPHKRLRHILNSNTMKRHSERHLVEKWCNHRAANVGISFYLPNIWQKINSI